VTIQKGPLIENLAIFINQRIKNHLRDIEIENIIHQIERQIHQIDIDIMIGIGMRIEEIVKGQMYLGGKRNNHLPALLPKKILIILEKQTKGDGNPQKVTVAQAVIHHPVTLINMRKSRMLNRVNSLPKY